MSWSEEIKKPVPILLVDDSENDREIFSHNTRQFHRELIEADSGELAVDLIKRRPDIKLVVLDEKLSGMSGMDVFECIQRLRPELKVIFLSGYVGDFVEKVNKIGFAIVMAKPIINGSKILSQMMTCLDIPLKP